ncbi:MarR family transcriptional regulator [Bacillus alkalicellulosilyticus]|uniref:MarR family transcriptional regulator n=1 Tax=Alkalihalobacterium alkalicellulosilyticum TaxID=1912214 RepID=UPI0014835F08|nr:MarR family transcriptional regulator [Bacillus alkalicellulosilyticus]
MDYSISHSLINLLRGTYKVLDEDWQKNAQSIGLTQSEQHLLWIVYFEKKAPMSRIAEIGLWDLSTVMQVIKRLKAKGLVQTIKDENDLRVSYVMVTEEGEEKIRLSSQFSYKITEYVMGYFQESEENQQFLEKMFEFHKDLNRHFHGPEFVKWLEKTGDTKITKDI